MGSRVYTVSGAGITLAGQPVTLVFINPSASVGIRILRAEVGQSGSTTSAQQRIQMNTQVTAFPTLTSATPAKHVLGDPTSGITGGTAGAAGTCGINASAEGAGAKTVLLSSTFNVLNGWLWVPTPGEVMEVNAGAASGWGLHLPVTAGTLTNWQFAVTFQEI